MAQWVPMPIKYDTVGTLMTATIYRIVEEGSDETIGGSIQSVIITTKGVSYPSVSFSPNPSNPHPEWTRVTADPRNLVTITGITGTIGVYHSNV